MTIEMKDLLNDEIMVNLETSERLTRRSYKALIKHAMTRESVSIDLGGTVIFTRCWLAENVRRYRIAITRFTDFKELTIRDKVTVLLSPGQRMPDQLRRFA